ncbi:MAG: ComEC/Rec2 family competence protein [Actinobacteria bacterium]|nr:ComEC/Rec2 family competence protein [Cyanobacteriota bacterium]MCL5772138.1 ComEC/Rec2 family competence protein [Actinomycetota bacterium]
MKYCYFIWALSVTAGIILFNLLVLKKINISLACIIFFILISFILSISGYYIFKKNLNIKKANLVFLIFTFVAFFSLGFINNYFNYLNNNRFNNLAENTGIFKNKNIKVNAVGQIVSNPYLKFTTVYFDFKIINLKITDQKGRNLQEINNCGDIFISYNYKGENKPDIFLNDFVEVNLKDIRVYQDSDKGDSYIFVADKITHTQVKGLKSYLYVFKSKIISCINILFYKNLDASNSKIASAVILGRQSEITNDVKESFRKSGIYHFLAISGLHISIIAAFICFIFKKIIHLFNHLLNFNNKINITYFIIAFLIFYNFIVGEKSGIIRASIMFSLALFAKDLHKDFKQSNIFFIAYIILLLKTPDYLTNIGFILSFISVGSLIFMIPVIKKLFKFLIKLKETVNNYILKSIIAAISVNAAILPILAYYFGGFSLIAVIVNVIVAPIFYILLLDLFISSFLSVFWFNAGSLLIKPANFLINIILKFSDFFGSLPNSYIENDIFKNKTVIFLYYFFLIAVFIYLYFFLKSKEIKNNAKNIV